MRLIFIIPAYLIYAVAGLYGFFICLGIVVDELGFIGGAVAFMFFPLTIAFAPWYAAIADGNWFPLILVYGGGAAGAVLYAIASLFDD